MRTRDSRHDSTFLWCYWNCQRQDGAVWVSQPCDLLAKRNDSDAVILLADAVTSQLQWSFLDLSPGRRDRLSRPEVCVGVLRVPVGA
jgi:hypothetical protein